MPYNARQVSILQSERTGDPLSRGYAAMSDVQFHASITAIDRPNPRISMSSGEVFEQIDSAEFTALSAAEKGRVDRLLGLGAEIIIGPGNSHQAISEISATFGNGSNTVSNLVALRDQQFSRAEETGLPVPSLGDVARTG